jgi:hypothetical protein
MTDKSNKKVPSSRLNPNKNSPVLQPTNPTQLVNALQVLNKQLAKLELENQ